MCDVAEFYCEKFVKARKPHKCCETGRMIQPGEMYWRISGKWDDVETFAQSEAAFHFARHVNGVGENGSLAKYDPEMCIPFGGIRYDLCDEDYEDEFKLVAAGRLTRWTLPTPPPPYYSPVDRRLSLVQAAD